MNRMPSPLALAIVSATSLALSGCFSSSSSSSSNSETPIEDSTALTSTTELEGEQQGEMIDAPVNGLRYWTASNGFGTTDDEGRFNFIPGEMVVFYVGDQVLMHTDAELITTPMDTITEQAITMPGAGHPHEAVNILRFLQSVDASPDDDSVIEVPASLADGNSNGLPPLDFAQSAMEFKQAVEGETIDGQPLSLVERAQAQEHLQQSLSNIGTTFDLRGDWEGFSRNGSEFGVITDLRADESLTIDEDGVVISGEELHTKDGVAYKTPFPVTDAVIDPDSDTVKAIQARFDDAGQPWVYDSGHPDEESIKERLEYLRDLDSELAAMRDGEAVIEVDTDSMFFFDGKCDSALCALSEMRSVTDDWDETCLHDEFDYSDGTVPDGEDTKKYCLESESHNGPVVGFSEVTYTDRLGGDRIIRLKRDFWFPGNPADALDGSDDQIASENFAEHNYFVSFYDRQEALEHTVDLTEGTWLLQGPDGTSETVQFNHDTGAEKVPFSCGDYSNCGWDEINGERDGSNVLYVRNTGIINWVDDGGFMNTLTRQ